MVYSFQPTAGSTKSLTAGTSTGNVAVLGPGVSPGRIQVRIYNSGTDEAFIRWGSVVGTTAALTDYPVAPGSVEVISIDVNNLGLWIAAITGSGTPILYFTVGAGI